LQKASFSLTAHGTVCISSLIRRGKDHSCRFSAPAGQTAAAFQADPEPQPLLEAAPRPVPPRMPRADIVSSRVVAVSQLSLRPVARFYLRSDILVTSAFISSSIDVNSSKLHAYIPAWGFLYIAT
jgi:hypothetical protein